jgi:hypothetical protein
VGWYSCLMTACYGFLTVLATTVMAPAAIRITRIALGKLGTDHSFLNVIDVVVFLLLNFSEFMLAGFLALRGRRRGVASSPVTESATVPVGAGASAS